MKNMNETMSNFLEFYGYTTSRKGLDTIINEWKTNKANLLEKFRKHPNWDEENLAIVFKDEQYERPFDSEAIWEFKVWAVKQFNEYATKNGVKTATKQNDLSYMESTIKCIEKVKENNLFIKDNTLMEGIFVDREIVEIKDRTEKLRKEIARLQEGKELYNGYYIEKEKEKGFRNFERAIDYIYNHCNSQYIDEDQASGINRRMDISAKEGQKLTRIIQKLCKEVKLTEVKDIRPRIEGSDEMKDFGFNHKFAIMADRINPVKYKRITVISLNPLDYWGMSFGYKWASCHTIDKSNKRKVGSNHYQGCYSSGTESYMLDSSSIIFYVIKEDYEGNTYWDEDKMQRVVFYVNEDGTLVLESRVYPDGRDGGDETIAAQFRSVMQKVIADVFENSNYWTVKKGTSNCTEYVSSHGTHYRDYANYEDCNISLLKGATVYKTIQIGHNPICPCCGETHRNEDNIMCEYCQEEYGMAEHTCERCGDAIGDDGVTTSDGHHYCCSDCAEEAGYIYCEDTYEYEPEENLYYCKDDYCYHNEENCYQDEYSGDYYSGEPEITTEDGRNYHSYENAEADGYVQTYEGYWYKEDECFTDNDGNWHCKDDGFETEDGTWFYTEADAEERGYICTEDEKWYTVEDAESEGYQEDEDGNWVLNDESEEIA